jgi:hypothetical protein
MVRLVDFGRLSRLAAGKTSLGGLCRFFAPGRQLGGTGMPAFANAGAPSIISIFG